VLAIGTIFQFVICTVTITCCTCYHLSNVDRGSKMEKSSNKTVPLHSMAANGLHDLSF